MHHESVAQELGIGPRQVEAVARLLGEDATVPFIARYRKEATGSLDEVQITAVRDRLRQLQELDKRREAIRKSLAERDLLTDELDAAVGGAETLSALEDVYLPFRPKRRTRATMARERGLGPLADALLAQDAGLVLDDAAQAYVDVEKGVASVEDALAGARDIIAESVSEDAELRADLRGMFLSSGTVAASVVKGKEQDGAKFRDYFDWREPVARAPSHRILAVFRGEKEGVLTLGIRPDEADALERVTRRFVKGASPSSGQVRTAAEDAYRRLLAPSLENETRAVAKERADAEAVRVFAQNVRELLMAAPLGQKPVLGIDPGFRTGCKVVVLDAQGKLVDDTVIYPTQSEKRKAEAADVVRSLCAAHGIQAVAIGNGTASRETEAFVRSIGMPGGVTVVMVNESGASVYSASKVAREEFPDKDVTVRGAASIGRRLMDPLAELVKIDPKAIGVGQYQHDVDQALLKRGLDDTVTSCVNAVGVEVNTASMQLLTYVSGLGRSLAAGIVKHRDANGPFASRAALKKVPRLGPKAFEQAAGFLRIRGAKNPLDASAVHPESYKIVDRMAKDVGCAVRDLVGRDDLGERIDLGRYVTESVGMPTLTDILAELARPGRDPRAAFEAFAFADGVNTIDDLQPGMKLPGIVTNVTNFGAFVDVGVHQDGLVHVSELADTYVKDPTDVVKVQQRVTVTVMSVDRERNRIALSMKSEPGARRRGSDRTGQSRAAPPRAGERGRSTRPERPARPRRETPPKRKERAEPQSNWLLDAMKKAQKRKK